MFKKYIFSFTLVIMFPLHVFGASSPIPSPSSSPSPSASPVATPYKTADGCYTSSTDSYRECLRQLRGAIYGASDLCLERTSTLDSCWTRQISSCIDAGFYCSCPGVTPSVSVTRRALKVCGGLFS